MFLSFKYTAATLACAMDEGYFDLIDQARNNPEFLSELCTVVDEIRYHESRGASGKTAMKKAMFQMLKLCRYNSALLVRYSFPRFNGVEPLSLSKRPFAFPFYDMLPYGSLTVRAGRQVSKCRRVGADDTVSAANGRPLLPDELRIHTPLLGLDHKTLRMGETSVVARHDAGVQPCVRVVFRNGAQADLSTNHPLLTLDGYREVSSLKPGDMVASMLVGGLFTNQVSVSRDRLILTAYMIGDGCCGLSLNFNFTSACQTSLDEFCDLARPLQADPPKRTRKRDKKKKQKAWKIDLSFKSTLRQWLAEDGSWGKYAYEKRLPAWVFDLDYEQTRLFLSRLWATYGMVKRNGSNIAISYSSSSKMLAADVRALLSKFGIPTSIKRRKTGYRKKSGEMKMCRDTFVVRVETLEGWTKFCTIFSDIPGKPPIDLPAEEHSNSNTDVLPAGIIDRLHEVAKSVSDKPAQLLRRLGLRLQKYCLPGRRKIKRALDHLRELAPTHPSLLGVDRILHSSLNWQAVKSITPLGDKPTWDVEVTGDHNYVLDGIVSHNSTNLCCRLMQLSRMIHYWKALYLSPHGEHAKTFADNYKQIETGFRWRQVTGIGSKFRDNLYYKEINATKSVVMIMHALTSAAHVRGKMADEVDYDEYQLFDPDLEGDVSSVQKSSKMPTTTYSGTSTTIDSPLETRFEASSQGFWNITLPHITDPGKRYLHCGDKSLVLRMIGERGPICPYTGRPINPINGRFVFDNSAAIAENNIGYHIPQFIVPDFIKPLEWYTKIYKFLVDYGEKKFLQEIAGIAIEEGQREITKADLQALCTSKKTRDQRITAATRGAYRWVISGCDWGGSDHQMARNAKTSYTLHAIAGVPASGPIDILHMRRYSGMEYEDIAQSIIEEHHKFGGFAMASDYGAGAFYNTYLHKVLPPNRHFMFGYGTPYAAMLKKPEHQYFPLHFTLNKTESMSVLFDAIKHQQFACYDWEEAQGYLMEFLNVQRIPSEKMFGQQYFRYIRAPTKTDDTTHALNFINILAKILRGEPIFDSSTEAERARQLWAQSGNMVPLRTPPSGGYVVSG